jgi:hypothetical protein
MFCGKPERSSQLVAIGFGINVGGQKSKHGISAK